MIMIGIEYNLMQSTYLFNQLTTRLVMEHKRKSKNRESQIISDIQQQEVVQDKSEIDKIEEAIIQDIINSDKTEYGVPSPPPIKTEEKNDNDRKEKTKEF